MNTEPPPQDKGGVRRRQVLDAAARCFSEHGFRGASIQRICEVAGMSPGHVYHYFRNKEAIVAGIVEQDLQKTLARIQLMRERGQAEGVLAACLGEVDTGVASCAGDPARLQLEILAEANRTPDIAALLQQADRLKRDELLALLRPLPALRGLSATELKARVAVMCTLFEGLAARTLLDPTLNRAATGRAISRVVRMLLEQPEET
uniref:TetR/AcrR family transcriptional regulator n=1 Tax=uncultured Pseudacidovorax sp. TaxID=679313 RepID=UPI0025F0D69F|nr:TetR/AcrR family transcriptional regulator [uncultured Pseudacidovorax sp.]